MAIAFVSDRGTSIQTGFNAGPVTLSPNATIAAGSLVILGMNIDTVFATGVTDNAGGNTWVVTNSGGGNRHSCVASCVLATQLTASSVVTVAVAGAVSEFYAAFAEFTGISSGTPDKVASAIPAFGTAVDGGTTAVTTQAAELVIGWFGTDTAGLTLTTPGAGYTAFGLVAAPRTAVGEWLIVSSTGAQHATGTMSGNSSSDGQTLTFLGAAGGGALPYGLDQERKVSQAVKRSAFFMLGDKWERHGKTHLLVPPRRVIPVGA